MKNYLILFGGCLASFAVNAQVGVNTIPHATAIFDMSNSKKGFLLSPIALISTSSQAPLTNVKEGVIVYNSTINVELSEGYYLWNGASWEPLTSQSSGGGGTVINVTNGINASGLGYIPKGTGDSAPATFTYNGVTATKYKCTKFTNFQPGSIEHSYCGYTLTGGVGVLNWQDSFEAAKQIGGYLPVITTNAEWNNLKANIAPTKTTSKTWLGYNKIAQAGNISEYEWITKERSVVDWNGSSSTPQNQFNPTTALGSLGGPCGFITSFTATSNNWNYIACTTTASYDYLIVEFQK